MMVNVLPSARENLPCTRGIVAGQCRGHSVRSAVTFSPLSSGSTLCPPPCSSDHSAAARHFLALRQSIGGLE